MGITQHSKDEHLLATARGVISMWVVFSPAQPPALNKFCGITQHSNDEHLLATARGVFDALLSAFSEKT